ncbi:MAG: GNAT family N-acetyltransferase [Fusobacteriaceae bacterium]
MEQKFCMRGEDGVELNYFIRALKNSDLENIRDNFYCSEESLDSFIQEEALEKHDRKERGTFLVEREEQLLAFFSVSFVRHQIGFKNDVPKSFSFLSLDYLAVDATFQNQKIGTAILKILLKEAKSLTEKFHCMRGIILQPINDNAKIFYMKNNFIETRVTIENLEGNDYFWIDSLGEEE